MPTGKATIASTLKSLDGKGLLDALKGATQTNIEVFSHNFRRTGCKIQIIIPKFKVDSKLDAVAVLQKMGVKTLFEDSADLSKVSRASHNFNKSTVSNSSSQDTCFYLPN